VDHEVHKAVVLTQDQKQCIGKRAVQAILASAENQVGPNYGISFTQDNTQEHDMIKGTVKEEENKATSSQASNEGERRKHAGMQCLHG
jgi:hypothetical protein